MEQAYLYIKRLLIFTICILVYHFTPDIIPLYVLIPILVLAFSLLHSRIAKEKPPHLFDYSRTESFFKKGGLRDLLRIFVTLFGIIYDIIIWALWSVYLVFLLFTDLLDLIRILSFRIIEGILWLLKQYLPFILLLFRLIRHYLARWPWWLYQIAYYNIRYAFNRNSLKIALVGTLIASIEIVSIVYLDLVVVKIPGIIFLGIIISLLPLSWSFGEIAAIRIHKLENESYAEVRKKFQNGAETVRGILFYITLFIVFVLIQTGLNLLGWIPGSGIHIAGFVFNINTLLSLFMIFIALLILMGVVILPSYRLSTSFVETKLSDSVRLLRTIFQRLLQYLFIWIPAGFFSALVIALPLTVVALAGLASYQVKNFSVDLQINHLKTRQAVSDQPLEAYKISRRIDNLEYLKIFPRNLFQELQNREILLNELTLAEEDLRSEREEFLRMIENAQQAIEEQKLEIEKMRSVGSPDTLITQKIIHLRDLQKDLRLSEHEKETDLAKLAADIDLLRKRNRQIPFMLFFSGIWIILFGSLVIAFMISYLGHTFQQVFSFQKDDEKTEWTKIVEEIRSDDPRQPLLGGTLFFFTAGVIYLFAANYLTISDLVTLVKKLWFF